MASEDENTDELDEKQIQNKIPTTTTTTKEKNKKKHVLWFIYIQWYISLNKIFIYFYISW